MLIHVQETTWCAPHWRPWYGRPFQECSHAENHGKGDRFVGQGFEGWKRPPKNSQVVWRAVFFVTARTPRQVRFAAFGVKLKIRASAVHGHACTHVCMYLCKYVYMYVCMCMSYGLPLTLTLYRVPGL